MTKLGGRAARRTARGRQVRVAAENGASPHQLMAIFEWLSLKEAERYVRAARCKRMARDRVAFMLRKETNNDRPFPPQDFPAD